MMKIGKLGGSLAATLALASLTACGSSGGAASDAMQIGTGGQGGTYYFVGVGMAQTLSKHTDLEVDAQASAGGLENVRAVASGKQQMGFVAPSDLADAFEDGTASPDDVQLLMAGHSNILQITVREDSAIETMEDLFQPGNSIGVGEPGSVIQSLAEVFLGAFDLTLEDIKPVKLSQEGMAQALLDNETDGAILGGGIPTASIESVNTTAGVRILPAPDGLLEKLQAKVPSMVSATIPEGTYEGVPAVETVADPVLLIASADVSEDDGYQIVKAIQTHTEELAKVHPSGAFYDAKDSFLAHDFLTGELGMEFHPGAVRWYEEKGVWPPAEQP